jgi:hypothetical protein
MGSTSFEIWDTDTANVLNDFPSEAAALTHVRQIVRRDGRDTVLTWELVRVPERGDAETIAIGQALADLADGVIPAP